MPDSTQKNNMTGLMDSVSGQQLKGIYGRINIEKLCYGQRLEYEVSNAGSTTINDGFCYQNVMSNTYTTDGNRTVLKPAPGTDTSGVLCENIFENFQHTDLYDFVRNDAGTWFVKPVLKIDSNIVDTDPTREIVRIKVINYSGDTIKNVIIKARNFAVRNQLGEYNYNGSYIDVYNFSEESPIVDLNVIGNTSSSGLGYGISPNYWEWEANSKIDFKVEWLGQTEVWFDLMRVDDEVANRLFDSEYDDLIDEEITYFTNHSSNYAFFTDELVYSNIPCVKYVKDRLNLSSLGPKFTFASSNYLNIRGLKNDNSASRIVLQKLNSELFFFDAYCVMQYSLL